MGRSRGSNLNCAHGLEGPHGEATSGNRAAEASHRRSIDGGVLQAQVWRRRAKCRDTLEQASDVAVREANPSTGKQHSVWELLDAPLKE